MNNARRNILKGAGAAGAVTVAVAAGLLKPGMVYAEWNKAAFDAKDLGSAMKGVGGVGAADSGQITVKAPDIAENGAVVPVEVISAIPGTDGIVLFGEKNGFPLLADFKLMNGAEGYVSTRIELGTTSNVRAVVKAGGKVYTAAKEVKVTIGGCGGYTDQRKRKEEKMAEPMKIRATMAGDSADIKCLMNHPMETGLRKDAKTGQIVPAHHITNVVVMVGSKTVMDAQWGGGISKNPYLAIKVKGASKGDKVTVNWTDNTGDKNTAETTIG